MKKREESTNYHNDFSKENTDEEGNIAEILLRNSKKQERKTREKRNNANELSVKEV